MHKAEEKVLAAICEHLLISSLKQAIDERVIVEPPDYICCLRRNGCGCVRGRLSLAHERFDLCHGFIGRPWRNLVGKTRQTTIRCLIDRKSTRLNSSHLGIS